MDKAKINNEIILMRKTVALAKLHVIKKLNREAEKLRKKKGTEAQKVKNSRKSKRLISEILSIKNVKKDDITNFNLQNTLTLEEILQNQSSGPLTRIMIRIGNYKAYKTKIDEFKIKYPNYMNFLGPGRKKKAKLERKGKLNSETESYEPSNTYSKNEISNKDDNIIAYNKNKNYIQSDSQLNKNDNNSNNNDEDRDNDKDKEENNDDDNHKDKREKKIENEYECGVETKHTVFCIEPELIQINIDRKRTKTFLPEQQKKVSISMTKKDNSIHEISRKSVDITKVISKEAIVKKFNEILEDDASDLDKKPKINTKYVESNFKIQKKIDSFFFTEDGKTNYLSVAPTKSEVANLDDSYESDNMNNKFHSQTFSRQIDNSFHKKFLNGNGKFDSGRLNPRWKQKKSNLRPPNNKRMGIKINLKKFNDVYNDDSNSYKEHSKSNFDIINTVLHPSWEAKKKQQEIMKKGFQGKKIVFDDV